MSRPVGEHDVVLDDGPRRRSACRPPEPGVDDDGVGDTPVPGRRETACQLALGATSTLPATSTSGVAPPCVVSVLALLAFARWPRLSRRPFRSGRRRRRLGRYLTDGQHAILEGLPPVAASIESAILVALPPRPAGGSDEG